MLPNTQHAFHINYCVHEMIYKLCSEGRHRSWDTERETAQHEQDDSEKPQVYEDDVWTVAMTYMFMTHMSD